MKKRTGFDLPQVLVLLMFLGVGVFGLSYGLTSLLDNYHFVRKAQPSEGVVVGLVKSRGSWAHSVATFKYPDGTTGRVVSDSATRSPKVGGAVEVLVPSHGPLAPRIYTYRDFWVIPCFALLFGTGFGGIAVSQIVRCLKETWRERQRGSRA